MITIVLIVSDLEQLKIPNFAQVHTHISPNTQTYFRDGATSASLLGNKVISLLTSLYNASDLQHKLFYLLHQS